MAASTQFGDVLELETAFRAAVLFKFGGSADADVFLGSPIMAPALTRMLDAIQEYWTGAGHWRRAESWRDIYVVSAATRHVELIASYAPRHPEWAVLTRHEQLEWLQVIAAPYRLDGPSIALFESILRK